MPSQSDTRENTDRGTRGYLYSITMSESCTIRSRLHCRRAKEMIPIRTINTVFIRIHSCVVCKFVFLFFSFSCVPRLWRWGVISCCLDILHAFLYEMPDLYERRR